MGGFSFPAEMIAKAIIEYKGPKVAFVPYAAMSGGTIIALATDEIFMGSAAVLGPIDTQYWGVPLSAFEYLKSVKSADQIDDENLLKLHLAQKFEQTALSRAKSRINAKHGKGVAESLMMSGRFHGDPISAKEAADMEIKVTDKNFPPEAYDLTDAKLKILELDVTELARIQLGLRNSQPAEKSFFKWW
jgi:hypothetical protein